MNSTTTPDALSIIIVGMSAVLATLTLLMALCRVNRFLADGLTALSSALMRSKVTPSVEPDSVQKSMAMEEEAEAQRRLVAVLTAAACETLGTRVRLLGYESERQHAETREWVRMGKQVILESHKVKLGR